MGFLALARVPIELAEAEVAVGDEGPQAALTPTLTITHPAVSLRF